MFGLRKPKHASAQQALELDLGPERVTVEAGFDRFRTLRISISRDGRIRVRAPQGTSLAALREHVLSRGPWILRHLERIRQRLGEAQPPRYVNGEGHRHLGQEYSLLVRQGPRNEVRLAGDGILVVTRRRPEPELVRRLLEAWRQEQARELFTRIIRSLLPRMDALGAPRPARLVIRSMRSRWGSCSRTRAICLNRQLIKAPLVCIEYVAAHELCHLLHFGHGEHFYSALSAVMPDWRERRQLLHSLPIL